MNFRGKTLAVIVAIFIIWIIIIFIVLGSVFQESFTRLEKNETQKNVKQVLNILSSENDAIGIINSDWASWDDTYAFIEDSDKAYIKSNLVDETFIGARLNLMLFINSSNQIVFGKAFDLEKEEEIPIPEDFQKPFLPNSLLTRHSNIDSRLQGIMLLAKSPMLITSRPILTSENEGPIRGTLLMGRYLESAEIELLTRISNLSVNVQKINDSQAPVDFQKAFSILSKEEPILIQPLNDELISGYALVNDIYGEPVLVLRVNIPRDIYRQSQIAKRYSIFSILVIAIIIILLVLFFLQRLVLSPMVLIGKYLDVITSTKDLSYRIPLQGKDELSKLPNTINLMLEKLEESSKDLWNSRELYKNLVDNVPGVFYRTDGEGNILMINPSGAKLLGYKSAEKVVGKNMAKDLYYFPDDRKKFLKELKKKKGIIKDYEITLKKRNGSLINVSASSHYYFNKKGENMGVEGIFVDITERVRNDKIQQVLYNISQAANSAISLKELYQFIHKELGTIINTTNFYISLIDKEKDQLYFPYYRDEKDDIFPPIINFSQSNNIDFHLSITGKSMLLNYSKIKELIKQKELSVGGALTKELIWLGTPLKIGDKIIGSMVVQSYTNPHLYTEGDIKMFEFASSQVAMAIQCKLTEETINKRQQEFFSLFQSSPEALVHLDEKSNILNVNPRFTELFGYTLEEVKGRNINDGMIHPSDMIEEGKNLDKIASSKEYFNYESIRKKKDGTHFPVSISGANIIINGEARGIIGTIIDITERKKMERELERLAHYDTLTNCYSRGYGLNLLGEQLKLARRKKTPILLIYLDVDNFKYINDTFGHQEGDKVLIEAVKLFKSTLREVDIICRLGGDEFLLIFPENSLDDVPIIRERLSKNLKKLNQSLNKPYQLNFSFGLSYYDPSNPQPMDELIRIADEKMYEEKKRKK